MPNWFKTAMRGKWSKNKMELERQSVIGRKKISERLRLPRWTNCTPPILRGPPRYIYKQYAPPGLYLSI
jgi:hypothetical protein